jgi:methylenetetrahydrofolate--tRNA-(uracil-5-)-methyltransferase
VIQIIGGGLAGCEAAWQAASAGVPVTIHEMRPVQATAVHKTDRLAELVCSNSFRGDKLDNAVGLLKEEMRRLGSLIMSVADAVRVPAGAALAVDREQFGDEVTRRIAAHPLIHVERGEISALPLSSMSAPRIIATGPLTSSSLAADIAGFVGRDHLAFFDAISPIVLAETIDMSKVFRASRWDRSFTGADKEGTGLAPRGLSPQAPHDTGDYLNCPMSRDEYNAFHEAIVGAQKAAVHDFDRTKFFEGCLPIEVMAHRGRDTLRFGPMKPSGLTDPRTGRWPYAVVQLRQDNLAGDHYSLVGFQTQLTWGEQARVLRMIPGLERAEFVRFGMIHRNTYINGPTVLTETWQTRRRPDLFFAGQVSGVEGYVESAASGLVAGINAARVARGLEPLAPPRTTAIGALAYYVSHADPSRYDPTNITFGIMPELDCPPRSRQERHLALSTRALEALGSWRDALGHPVAAVAQPTGERPTDETGFHSSSTKPGFAPAVERPANETGFPSSSTKPGFAPASAGNPVSWT